MSRSSLTRSCVAKSDGAVVGIALNVAIWPGPSSATGVTASTPSTLEIACCRLASCGSSGCAGLASLAAKTIGPLAPTPKPSVMSS